MTVRGRQILTILQTFIVSRLCWRGASQSQSSSDPPKQDENLSSCFKISSDGLLTNEGSSEISLPGTSAYIVSVCLSMTNRILQVPAEAMITPAASPVPRIMTGSVNPALTRSCDQVSETSAHPDSPNPNRASRIVTITPRAAGIFLLLLGKILRCGLSEPRPQPG